MELKRKHVTDQRVGHKLGIWMLASAVVLGSLILGAGFLIREGIVEAERLRERYNSEDTLQRTSKPEVQVLFTRPEGMQIRWDETGGGDFDSLPLVVPGRHSFSQGAIHRFKLTNIQGREGMELYPTVEIRQTTPRTEAYFAHNAIPVQFTAEDFDQVMAGNDVTTAVFMPDPVFAELEISGGETITSTRLESGIDPVVEADRRGEVVAVIRLGKLPLPGI